MPADLLGLLGSWWFDRRLLDRRADLAGCVHGTLTITPDGDGLRWHESGEMTWAGRTFPATRTLRASCRGKEWWLDFADGRPFHPWRPGEWVTHPCAADTYRGRVEIGNEDRWRITWEVTGPAKDQLLITRLRRPSTR